MTELTQAIVQGVIEGLTEFLPVSSTGHMVLAEPWLGIDGRLPPWPTFRYFIQIGAILAVIVYFWRRLWRQVLKRPDSGLSNHVVAKVGLAMIPGAIAGLALDDFMEEHLEKPLPVAVALIAGAVVMIAVERACGRRAATAAESGAGPHPVECISLRQALFVGLAQCVSVIPGTSRAMATIMGGVAVGLPPAVAAEFSFYLAIPTLCGAGLLRIVKHWSDIRSDDAGLLAAGFVVAFLVALLVVGAFMRYLQTRPLWPFAIYRIALGLLVLLAL